MKETYIYYLAIIIIITFGLISFVVYKLLNKKKLLSNEINEYNQRLNNIKEELYKANVNKSNEIDNYNRIIDDIKNEINSLNSELNNIKLKYENYKKRKTQISNEIYEHSNKLNELKEDIKKQNENKVQEIESYNHIIVDIKNEINSLNSELNNIKLEYEKYKKEETEISNEIYYYNQRLNELKEDIKNENENKTKEIEHCQRLIDETKNEMYNFNRERYLAKKEYEKCKKEVDEIKLNKIKIEDEFENIKQQFEYAKQIISETDKRKKKLDNINDKINSLSELEKDANKKIKNIQSKIDLYERIDNFVDYGFFENPDYLFNTSEKYSEEIKKIRNLQKEMIANDKAVVYNQSIVDKDKRFFFIKETCKKQKKMVIRSYNIECDYLIEKVNPSNITRTINRIIDIAKSLETDIADMSMGINNDYIELKLQECKIQYEFKLKKKEEKEEQRAIREQIREEERLRKEYEKATIEAQKEEDFYQQLLNKAKKALSEATETEKKAMESRIKELEAELSEIKLKVERAKSMAEQTKKGYVYIISNIGSFGDNIYKIGLTRRLDPTERIRELSDASVPFAYDIHAMIASDDAPALEKMLHREFWHKRVYAVNMRKEFFNVKLDEIRDKVITITGKDTDFIMTKLAEEFYQTQRLKNSNDELLHE